MKTPDGICKKCSGTGKRPVTVTLHGKQVTYDKPCKTCGGTGELYRK